MTPYVIKAVEQFLSDPPDTEYQRGFLAALLLVWSEGMNGNVNDVRFIAADDLCSDDKRADPTAARVMTFQHEWYFEGLRHGPGRYVLTRTGPVPDGYEPAF